MKRFINTICISLLFLAGNTFAMLVNGSFEYKLHGWSTIGYVYQTKYWSSDGDYSVALKPAYSLSDIESKMGLAGDSLALVSDLVNPGSTEPMKASIIYQSLKVNAGDRINFDFDIAGSDAINNWNYGAIVLFENGMLSEYYSISSLVAATNASCPCDCESKLGIFNTSTSGNATIGFMIFNEKYAYKNPIIKLDNVNANISAIPIPAAGWLFPSGLFCMLGILQKGKKITSCFN